MDKNNTDNNKEKKLDRSQKIRIAIGAFLVIDFIIFIILFLLLPRYCSKKDVNNSSNVSSIKEPYNGQDLNNRLLNLVKEQIELDGFDEDNISSVVTFSYEEDVQGNFKINITASSDENAYLYTATSCKYEIKDDKDNPFNHLNSGDFTINGDISVSKYKKTAGSVEVATSNAGTVRNGNFITYESVSNNKYFSGYRFKDNQLKIYQHIEVNDEFTLAKDIDPLKNIKPDVAAKVEIVNNNHPLYDFYTYLGTL